jgi:hypothetical protein
MACVQRQIEGNGYAIDHRNEFIAYGSFETRQENYISVLQAKGDDLGTIGYHKLRFPATKIRFANRSTETLLFATSGDYFRLWELSGDSQLIQTES